jgi:hypothetical protein
LLILIVPMLVVGRRWKMLQGMMITGLSLVVLSLLFVGWDVNVSYLGELLSFNKSTSSGNLEIRTWKYVDLNNSLRLILGIGSPLQRPLFAAIGFIPLMLLVRAWWISRRYDDDSMRMLWATTLSWTPILNLYVGIYDSILIVQSVLITSAVICRGSKTPTPLIGTGFAYLLLLIYIVPWFSQYLAASTGISIYPYLLMGLGTYQIGRLFGMPYTKLNDADSLTQPPRNH